MLTYWEYCEAQLHFKKSRTLWNIWEKLDRVRQHTDAGNLHAFTLWITKVTNVHSDCVMLLNTTAKDIILSDINIT
jgi:hypothetical protein